MVVYSVSSILTLTAISFGLSSKSISSSGNRSSSPAFVVAKEVCGVAVTKSPVIFVGTGEHMNEFEEFDVKPFVSRLLGMSDLSGFRKKVQEVVPMDQQSELLQKLSEREVSH